MYEADTVESCKAPSRSTRLVLIACKDTIGLAAATPITTYIQGQDRSVLGEVLIMSESGCEWTTRTLANVR